MKNSNSNHKTQHHTQKHSSGGTNIDQHDLDRIADKSEEPVRVRESIFQTDCDMRKRYAELMSGLIENLSLGTLADNDIKNGGSNLLYGAIQEIEESEPSNSRKRFQIY